MRTQHAVVLQPDRIQILLSADPAYPSWADERQLEDQAAFDAWLCSPAGELWIEQGSEADLESRCLTDWEGW